MEAGDFFDEWARNGRDDDMANRHWHTAKHAIRAMPLESGQRVLDLGCGNGYASRAIASRGVSVVGIDAAGEMLENARGATADNAIEYVRAGFESVPFQSNAIDHAFSMEAFYYSKQPRETLASLVDVLAPGGTFYCAVNFYEENHYSHEWQALVDAPMTLWDRSTYRGAFREAGFHVAGQWQIPDRDREIPDTTAFPTENFETRKEMVERYRTLGTLLTVAVVP